MLPMQSAFLKAAKEYESLALYAETGSGKTLAFLLAALEAVPERVPNGIVVIAPSRELCLQIEQVFRSLRTGRNAVICYGGHSVRTESNRLANFPEVLIATPGRLCDHLRNERIPHADLTQMLIIDEFDKCLEAGFSEEMHAIFDAFPYLKKKVLVSATNLAEIPTYCRMSTPFILDERSADNEPDIREVVVPYKKDVKEAVFNLLCHFNNEKAIVFCNYREVSEDLAAALSDLGLVTTCYHGGLEQDERERALIKFRNDSTNILVCTDLGSRGLDIPEIRHVIHYQLPSSEEAYVHRKGRTARMGANGHSYLLKGTDTQFPFYITEPEEQFKVGVPLIVPKPKKRTIYVSAGKKDKVNKVDIVGFFIQQGGVNKTDIGLITVLDNSVYVALPSKSTGAILEAVRDKKLKGKRLKIAVSK